MQQISNKLRLTKTTVEFLAEIKTEFTSLLNTQFNRIIVWDESVAPLDFFDVRKNLQYMNLLELVSAENSLLLNPSDFDDIEWHLEQLIEMHFLYQESPEVFLIKQPLVDFLNSN